MYIPVDLLNTIGTFLCENHMEMLFRVNKGGICRIRMRRKYDEYFKNGCRWVTSYALHCKQTQKDYDWLDDYFPDWTFSF